MTGASDQPVLVLDDLWAAPAEPTDAAPILRGVSLTVPEGELHALMGPNGSGKTTLAAVLMGSPEYTVRSGSIVFRGTDVTDWEPDRRARAGMFLAFQYPQEVQGVAVRQFLRQAMSARTGVDLSILEVRIAVMEWMERLGMDPSFADRHVNQGFSGGEKKRNEILQLALLEPALAILDETDSGLDLDALDTVAKGVSEIREERPELTALVITHYQRLLDLLPPDRVHVLLDGRIVADGGPELALRLEADGFEGLRTGASA